VPLTEGPTAGHAGYSVMSSEDGQPGSDRDTPKHLTFETAQVAMANDEARMTNDKRMTKLKSRKDV
jgi:hypothetical protein